MCCDVAKLLIIGGSGLVGGRLLDLLAGSTDHEIMCLLRRPVNERKGIGQQVATQLVVHHGIAGVMELDL